MPVIHPGGRVLVTGATGFIASWVIHNLLQRGFRVRGTVRSVAKGKDVGALFSEFGSKFEYMVVEDVQKDGAFDEAVKGVDAVEHLASPIHLFADDPQEVIGPALKGTIGILSSVMKHGSAVKRVVITSSAVTLPHIPTSTSENVPQKFTENDWNETSPKIVQELGRQASGADKYITSKILAERAAWEFVKKNKGDVNWDLVTLIPPWVFGPMMNRATDPSGLGFSCGLYLKFITNRASLSDSDLSQPSGNGHFVDVRDLAFAHVESLVRDGAGSQRLIVAAGVWTWQDFVDALAASSLASSLPQLPKGVPRAGKKAKHLLDYDSSKVKETFGMQFRSLEETAIDSAQSFIERGWVEG